MADLIRPFSADSLKELFALSILKEGGAPLRPPSRRALAILATQLNGFARLSEFDRQNQIYDEQILKPAMEAARTLVKLMPKIIDHERLRPPNAFPPGERLSQAGVLDALVGLQGALRLAIETGTVMSREGSVELALQLGISTSMPPRFLTWPDMQPLLEAWFVNAMKSTNPDFSVGRSNDGPYPRFITAVAPYLTGESPTTGAAAQKIKRMSRGTFD